MILASDAAPRAETSLANPRRYLSIEPEVTPLERSPERHRHEARIVLDAKAFYELAAEVKTRRENALAGQRPVPVPVAAARLPVERGLEEHGRMP